MRPSPSKVKAARAAIAAYLSKAWPTLVRKNGALDAAALGAAMGCGSDGSGHLTASNSEAVSALTTAARRDAVAHVACQILVNGLLARSVAVPEPLREFTARNLKLNRTAPTKQTVKSWQARDTHLAVAVHIGVTHGLQATTSLPVPEPAKARTMREEESAISSSQLVVQEYKKLAARHGAPAIKHDTVKSAWRDSRLRDDRKRRRIRALS
jgi:hypothetical protein